MSEKEIEEDYDTNSICPFMSTPDKTVRCSGTCGLFDCYIGQCSFYGLGRIVESINDIYKAKSNRKLKL